MSAQKPARADRVERIVRTMLGAVLLAAVIWSIGGGAAGEFGLQHIWS